MPQRLNNIFEGNKHTNKKIQTNFQQYTVDSKSLGTPIYFEKKKQSTQA